MGLRDALPAAPQTPAMLKTLPGLYPSGPELCRLIPRRSVRTQ